MKAKLFLEDIGGFKGKKEFEFESGTLNIIEAPNSGGKSSLVKALVGILSIPNDGKLDQYFSKEGKFLGILSDEFNTQKGFVNIHSEVGEVKLDLNDTHDDLKVRQNGSYLSFPQRGDPKFLLSGILSNDTKILRQLRNTDESQPDEFNWAVTKLSKASNYDEITEFLKSEKDIFIKQQFQSEKLIQRTEQLTKEITDLEKELKSVENKLAELVPKFKGKTEDLIKSRKDTLKKIEDLNKKIIDKKSNIDERKIELEKNEKFIEKIDQEIKAAEKQLNELELFDLRIAQISVSDLKKIKADKISKLNEEIETLKENRGKVDGVYNLYYLAQSSLKNDTSIKCPLCDEGNLHQDKLQKKIESLKREKDLISSKIMDKNQEIRSIDKNIENILQTKEELNSKIGGLKHQKGINLDKIKNFQRSYKIDNDDVTKYSKEKEELEGELRKIIDLIGKDDEEINKLYSEQEARQSQLKEQIIIKNNEIKGHSVEVKGKKFVPTIALKLINEYIKVLENLIDYTKKSADKQRQAAADKFNDAIKSLMTELDFKEFKEVKLNKDFRLYIERLDPRTKEYVSQLVSTLSTSEKLTIALILQIAIKETYLRHVPFLILDDVMEDFDEDRRNKIYHYLAKKAKEQDWIIISTKLKEEKIPIRVVGWKGI